MQGYLLLMRSAHSACLALSKFQDSSQVCQSRRPSQAIGALFISVRGVCTFALTIAFCILQIKRLHIAVSLNHRLKRFSIIASQIDQKHCGILCIFTEVHFNIRVTIYEGGLKYQSFLLCSPCSTITQHLSGLQAGQSLLDFGGLLKLLVLEGVFWTDQAQRAYQAWILGEHPRPRRPDLEAYKRNSHPNHSGCTDKVICQL